MKKELINWLEEFSHCVREENYERGFALCDPDIFSFGTVARSVKDLETLKQQQWQIIWPNTQGFHFLTKSAVIWIEANMAGIAAEWKSTGLGKGGISFEREGRSSILLRKIDGNWRAIHTHFSKIPAQEFPNKF